MPIAYRRVILSLILAIVAPAFGEERTAASGNRPLSVDERTALFAYDSTQPPDVKVRQIEGTKGYRLWDISLRSDGNDRITAYVVAPESDGKHPAILFGHWGDGERAEFLSEAILMARLGVVSILPDYPWTRPASWRRALRYSEDPANDFAVYRQTVTDLRRCIDYLVSRGDVDAKRVGYVGHSYGAQWGAILAAVDRRLSAAVLAGGVPDLGAIYLESDDPELVELRTSNPDKVAKLLDTMAPLAAVEYIGSAYPTPLFFQFATFDRNVPRAAIDRYFAAAREPKHIRWYPTGHELNDPAAVHDRAVWLAKQLGLSEPPAANNTVADVRSSLNETLEQEVHDTEVRFAETMKNRDFAAFKSFVAEDAVFFSRRGILRGKTAVLEAWKAWFEGPVAPFGWAPAKVKVLDSGELALSTGPVSGPAGESYGIYTSVWRRKPDRTWELVFDRGCACASDP